MYMIQNVQNILSVYIPKIILRSSPDKGEKIWYLVF